MAEPKYGGTVTNVKRKRVPGGGRSYSKTTRTKACADTWDSHQTMINICNKQCCSGNCEIRKMHIFIKNLKDRYYILP